MGGGFGGGVPIERLGVPYLGGYGIGGGLVNLGVGALDFGFPVGGLNGVIGGPFGVIGAGGLGRGIGRSLTEQERVGGFDTFGHGLGKYASNFGQEQHVNQGSKGYQGKGNKNKNPRGGSAPSKGGKSAPKGGKGTKSAGKSAAGKKKQI